MAKTNKNENMATYDVEAFLDAVRGATENMAPDIGQLVNAATKIKLIEQRFPSAPLGPLYLGLGTMGYDLVPKSHQEEQRAQLYEDYKSLVRYNPR